MHKTLIIIRGLPGAGKSTLASLIGSLYPTAVLVSEDDFWTHSDGTYNFTPETSEDAATYMITHALKAISRSANVVVMHTATCSFDDPEWAVLFQNARYYRYSVFPLIIQRNTNNPESLHHVRPEDMERFRREMEHGLEITIP